MRTERSQACTGHRRYSAPSSHEPQPRQHSIRRIVLPSGRAIEVVRFHLDDHDHARPARLPGMRLTARPAARVGRGARGFWELTLHCPNCDWLDEGVFDQDQVDALEEHLDDGLAEMLNDLRRLTQANMAEEIDRFAAALEADLILPEDF